VCVCVCPNHAVVLFIRLIIIVKKTNYVIPL
jgi:hypothetical protein